MPSQLEPLTVTVQEALRISGLGHSKFAELINSKRVETVKVDNRRLVVYRSLKALLGQTEATA